MLISPERNRPERRSTPLTLTRPGRLGLGSKGVGKGLVIEKAPPKPGSRGLGRAAAVRRRLNDGVQDRYVGIQSLRNGSGQTRGGLAGEPLPVQGRVCAKVLNSGDIYNSEQLSKVPGFTDLPRIPGPR